ncbi:MAG: sulfurtransferase complex subunit TusD [Pseudomonadota bacterium]|jgi:tRNA 2-thiouridine synthesizing protein D
MSSFSLVVHGAPYTSQASVSALHFCRAALAGGHTIYRLFFFQDGVHNASALIVPPQDELHIPHAWQQLIQQYGLDAIVCVSSALKRGLVNDEEAARYDKPAGNVLPGFTVGGLGQLIDALQHSDRLLNFAP